MAYRFLLPLLFAWGLPAVAQQGITSDSVTFAQIAALDGPAGALGSGMQVGIRAAFEEANRAGGIHGRQVLLESFDDGYEPEQSVAQLQSVLAGDAHLGLVGSVGTPTSQAIQPLAAAQGIPFIAPFTGAEFLRDATLTNVVNVRASYNLETERWIQYLADEKGVTKIALLYQDDAFGRAGQSGVIKAMEKRGLSLVAQGSYVRNTTAVKTALVDIRNSGAEAVVMVGAYKPVAEFIRLSRKLNFNPVFMTISFVGSDALVQELSSDGAGVIISQVVPFPSDTSSELVARYQAALAAHDPGQTPGFVSLEGYLSGRLILEALQAAGPTPTREGFLATLRSLQTVDLNGMTLTYGTGDNQGSDDVFMTVISPEGTIVPLGS